jgi:hypothetical protein
MALWKMPPKAKVYEALSAVADHRVHLKENLTAEVVSSSGDKTYVVQWTEDFTRLTSNDNASYWQGYLGYPIVAVLMETGKLTFDSRIADQLAGIPWKRINKQHKNNYDLAVAAVLDDLAKNGVDTTLVQAEVDQIYEQLESSEFERLSQGKSPPKDAR